jgi:hypothetical protein
LIRRDDEFDRFDEDFFKTDSEYIKKQIALEEKIKQEELDAEFARRLQGDLPSINLPSSSGPNAFNRMGMGYISSQSSNQPLQPSTRLSPGHPWPSTNPAPMSSPSIKLEPRRLSYGAKSTERSLDGYAKPEPSSMQTIQTSGFRGTRLPNFDGLIANPRSNGSTGVKAESCSRSMPGSFTDDLSDASDSDIEIIEPSEFKSNGRYRQGSMVGTPARSSLSLNSLISAPAAIRNTEGSTTKSALRQALYGNQAAPSWLKPVTPQPAGSFLYSDMGNMMGNEMGNKMTPGMQAYGSVPGAYVYGGGYPAGGSSQSPLSIDDDASPLDMRLPNPMAYSSGMFTQY